MAAFPLLKTGCVAQFPFVQMSQFQTVVLRFIGGGQQRYQNWGGTLHKWTIRLDLLDEFELIEYFAFFKDRRGMAEIFDFTDPWDLVTYPNCSIEKDSFAVHLEPGNCWSSMVIKENL